MWYDWMVGGWGGRNGKDGSNATAPIFGVGLAVQPLEGQERLVPVLTTRPRDRHRLRRARDATAAAAASRRAARSRERERTVMSYCCDRARSITWGMNGGLPSIPHGVWLNKGTRRRALPGRGLLQRAVGAGRLLHAPVGGRRRLRRPARARPRGASARTSIDGYVSVERALKDYGVVVDEVDADLDEYEVDAAATERERGPHRAASAPAGSRRTPRTSRGATATASSTCSTSCATTA